MSRKPNLAALVGSRICHDLISPLGAIGNGVELLELTGIPKSPEIALIEESVAAANARLRFFRIAYGGATEGQSLARADIASTLASVARGGRISYFWEAEGDCDKRIVRVIFLLLQCLERALPYGGDIVVQNEGEGWRVQAEAERMKVDAAMWASLTDARARPVIGASDVQFALLPEALADIGRTLSIETDTTHITIRL